MVGHGTNLETTSYLLILHFIQFDCANFLSKIPLILGIRKTGIFSIKYSFKYMVRDFNILLKWKSKTYWILLELLPYFVTEGCQYAHPLYIHIICPE